MLSAKFLQGVIFDRDKIQQAFPVNEVRKCIDTILGIIPRESYRFSAAGNVDGKLTMVLVFDMGDDEGEL
jgi:hypothetical protein